MSKLRSKLTAMLAVLFCVAAVSGAQAASLPKLSVLSTNVIEGNSGTAPMTFTVMMTATSATPTLVFFATSDGTALAASDYVATNGMVTIPSGNSNATFTVLVNGDTTVEPNETFTVTLTTNNAALSASTTTNATISAATATGTIYSDEPLINVSNPAVSEPALGKTTNMVFVVTLTQPLAATITVNYATSNGTAIAGLDYTAKSGTLTFLAGKMTNTVTVPVNGDTLTESAETLYLNLFTTATTAALSSGAGTRGTGTINDSNPGFALISGSKVTEGNSGLTNLIVWVKLTTQATVSASVNYSTADGTAIAGSDYLATNGTVTIPAGQLSNSFTVAVIGDTVMEGNETILLYLTNALPTSIPIVTASTSATITDDESPMRIVSRSLGAFDVGNSGPYKGKQKAYGHRNVALLTPAYLELQVTTSLATKVTSISWTNYPNTSPASTAGLTSSPITNRTWTFNYGEGKIYSIPTNLYSGSGTLLDARRVLKPDVEGIYTIVATVGYTNQYGTGIAYVTNTIIGATWVGAQECKKCHVAGPATNDNYDGWMETAHSDALKRKADFGPSFTGARTTNSFGLSCYLCHAVGYDAQVTNSAGAAFDNGGFFYQMTNTSWTLATNLVIYAKTNYFITYTNPTTLQVSYISTNTDLTNGTAVYGPTNGNYTVVNGNICIIIPNGTTSSVVAITNAWETMPTKLQQKGNIQCENCHGPASLHGSASGATDPHGTNYITVSVNAEVCGFCHDSFSTHSKNFEWQHSNHCTGEVFRATGDCRACHSAIGFIDKMQNDGKPTIGDGNEGITCSACHDPHSGQYDDQLRTTEPVALGDPLFPSIATISDGGTGQLCMNCHRARRTAVIAVNTNFLASTSAPSPHHGPMADVLEGYNGIEYGGLPETGAAKNPHAHVPDTCVFCHMQNIKQSTVPAYSNSFGYAQGHTWKMIATNGQDIVQACVMCHAENRTTAAGGAEVDEFDLSHRGVDYVAGSTNVLGVQSQVKQLLTTLGSLLGKTFAVTNTVGNNVCSSVAGFNKAKIKAAWNYNLALEDRSYGVHNPGYIIALLKASIADVQNAQTNAHTLYFQAPAGQVWSWTIDQLGVKVASNLVFSGTTSWKMRTSGDIDGNNAGDLIWQYATGETAGWLMNSNGVPVKQVSVFFGSTSTVVSACGDLNKDGIADLFCQRSTGVIDIWFMNADGTVASTGVVNGGRTTTLKLRAAGDVNKDGMADLIMQTATGQIQVWFLNPDGSIQAPSPVTTTSAASPLVVRATCDVDNDGTPDLLLQAAAGGPVTVLYMTPTGATPIRSSVVTPVGGPATGLPTALQLRGAGM